MYILLGLGFTFLFNIMGILNFAHGVIYMIGAYICFYFGHRGRDESVAGDVDLRNRDGFVRHSSWSVSFSVPFWGIST